MTKQVRQSITPTHVLGSTGTAEGDTLGHRALADLKADLGLDAATGLPYDNSTSGLSATDVQAALDELASSVEQNNVILATTKVRRNLTVVPGSTVPRSGLNTWAFTTGNQAFIYELNLTEEDLDERNANRPITLRWPATGAFSDIPDYQEFAGTSGIGSRIDMSLDSSQNEYFATITLDATTTKLRLRWGATSTAACELPYILYQNQYIADTSTIDYKILTEKFAQSVAETSGDLYAAFERITIQGSAFSISRDGRILDIPASTISEVNIYVTGVLSAGEFATLVIEFLSIPAGWFRSISLGAHSGLAGGGAGVSNVFWVDNYAFIRLNATAANNLDPRYLPFRVDNRDAVTPTQTAQNIKIKVHGLFKGAIDPKKFTDIEAVKRYLSIKSARPAYVSALAPSDDFDIYPTLESAYVAGHKNIYINSGTFRMPRGLSINRDLILHGDNAQDEKPILCTSENVPEQSWTPTAADATVYYYATNINPNGLWEISSSGEISRMGVDTVVTGRRDQSASEAAVQSAADGAWWYGAGTEGTGVYMKPYGATISGKSYELPRYNETLLITSSAFEMRGVSVLWGSVFTVTARLSTVITNNCTIGRSGNDNGANVGIRTLWTDFNGDYLDAGDDGVDSNGSCSFITYGGIFRECRGDGLAPHGVGNNIYAYNAKFINNYKQGFVTVGSGNFFLNNCLASNNSDVDILVLLSGPNKSYIEFIDCVSDETRPVHSTSSLLTGKIINHNGPIIAVSGDIKIQNHVCLGAGTAFNIALGTVSLDNFNYRSNGTGINMSGGNLTAKDGQILRGSIGISKSGGTITLDSNRPINIPGTGVAGAPTTRTSGLSAGEIADLESVAAV